MCPTPAIGESTCHRRKNRHGGVKADEVKRLEGPGREDERLKRPVADLSPGNQTLEEAAGGNRPAPPDAGGRRAAVQGDAPLAAPRPQGVESPAA
jgi:hypothetical protein